MCWGREGSIEVTTRRSGEPISGDFEILGAAEMEQYVHTVLGRTEGGIRPRGSPVDAFFHQPGRESEK